MWRRSDVSNEHPLSPMSKPSAARDQHADATREPTGEQDSPDHGRTVEPDTEGWNLEDDSPPLAKLIRVTSFWGAIFLPVLYVPLLVIGLSTSFELLLFLGLVALNLLALYVGHAHRRQSRNP